MVAISPDPKSGLRFDGRITVGNVLTLIVMIVAVIGSVITGVHMYDALASKQDAQGQQISAIEKNVDWMRRQIELARNR